MRRLLVALLLLLATPALAQKPPINGVAGPTTSAQFQGIITDEVGSGVLSFGIITPALGGTGVNNGTNTFTLTGSLSAGSGTSYVAAGPSALATCGGVTDNCGGSVAFGDRAGSSLGSDPARSSVFIGAVAGQWVTGGGSNTFVGAFAGRGGPSTGALSPPLTGADNSCFGEAACINIHGSANFNSAYGFNSLFWLEEGSSNNAFGIGSCANIINTNSNNCFGTNAYGFGQGTDGVIVGFGAGRGTFGNGVTTGSSAGGQPVLNVVDTTPYHVGDTVYSCCTRGGTTILSISAGTPGTITLSTNIQVTMGAGIPVYDITNPHTGTGATLVGYLAGSTMQGTIHPTIVGANAGSSLTTGVSFSALGYFAGGATTTQANVTVVGAAAGQNTTAASLTAVGTSACAGSSGTPLTGSNMVCIGNSAGLVVQGAANGDVFVGTAAGNAVTTSSASIYIGSSVASAKTTGNNEIVIGANALDAQVTGSGNTVIGASSGASCTACVDNIIIGRSVDALAATGSGKLNIGNGIFGTNMSQASGTQKIGINTGADPTYTLDVTGDVNSSTLYRAGGTAGVTCSVAALGATITVKGGIITALTGC